MQKNAFEGTKARVIVLATDCAVHSFYVNLSNFANLTFAMHYVCVKCHYAAKFRSNRYSANHLLPVP